MSKNTNGLLHELERLEKAVETGDFKITLFEGDLTGDDEKAIQIINKFLGRYQKAVEYEIMKYKLTSDALHIALWDMDIVVEDPVSPNNKFTWSKEFRQMLGFNDERDFPNLLSSWSDRLHKDDKERTLKAFTAHITDLSGKTPYDIEYRLMLKSGEYRYFHAYGNTLRNIAGIPLRVAGALMDITEKVEMAKALEDALEEAKTASNAKSEFLANMSHEMRTPLNAIIGLTGVTLENDALNEEIQKLLEKVHTAGTSLLDMVNDILDISESNAEIPGIFETSRFFSEKYTGEEKLNRIDLPYAHVLVVDDNPTNLDVAKGMMKPYGMKIACVDSGQKAIDAIIATDGRFDVIFMDQMMPGMDGVETARKIREIGTEYAKSIPIIALTANAIDGNEEMFLDKGFQAFLSKPIDMFRLDAVIRQWIYDEHKEKAYSAGSSSAMNQKKDENEKISFLNDKKVAGIDFSKGIKRFGGYEETYLEILRAYVINNRKILSTISEIKKEGIKSYEITIHGIKGSNYSICADDLGDAAKRLEQAAKENDWDYINENNMPFIEDSRKLMSDLDELFESIDTEADKHAKVKPDVIALTDLRTACDTYDMDAVDAAMEEINRYRYKSDEGLVDWLQENVDQMNFSDIVDKLSALR